jgi:hypothetical protein
MAFACMATANPVQYLAPLTRGLQLTGDTKRKKAGRLDAVAEVIYAEGPHAVEGGGSAWSHSDADNCCGECSHQLWLDRATTRFRFFRPASRYTGSFCVFGPALSSPAHALISLDMR